MTEDEAAPADGRGLDGGERGVLAAVLALIAALAIADLAGDLREGVTTWHVRAEGAVVVAACVGIALLLRGAWALKHRLADQSRDFSAFRAQAEAWRSDSRRYVEGLSRAIDRQLDLWALSAAEKDIAFLLLKGLSLKEIASARGTSEKTVRAQSVSVYAKSGVTGRSELSAFFLEDLLPPAAPPDDSPAK